MRIAWIAVAMMIASHVGADSNPPAPTPAKESHPPQQTAAEKPQATDSDQRGTEQRPFFITVTGIPIVKVEGSPKTDGKPTQHEDRNEDGAPREWWLRPDALTAWSTLALFLVGTITAIILICQSRLIARQLRLARDEFNAAHRPKIRIKHVWLTGEFWSAEQIFFTLVIVNVGDAAARITEIRYGVSIIEAHHRLPQKPVYPNEFPMQRVGENIEPGRTFEFVNFSTNRIISETENPSVRQGKSKLYIYGHVEYTAVPRDTRQGVGDLKNTAFCRVLELPPEKTFSHLDMGRLVRHQDPDYEYED